VKRLALSVVFGLLAVMVSMHAQDAPPTKVARVEFMKIVPGKGAEYQKLETLWKTEIHQDRVNKGQVESWNLFVAMYPGGTKREYDVVAMHIFSSFEKMETMLDEAQSAKVQKFPAANELREMVRYEIWQLGASAGDPFAGKFADVRFHKAINGNGAEYVGAIRDLWKPLNEELVKKGSRKGWLWFSVMFPGGTSRPYDWITLDSLDKFGDVAGNSFAGADQDRLRLALEVSSRGRETPINEYWRLVDRTSPKLKQGS
jgi:hypothetical protein